MIGGWLGLLTAAFFPGQPALLKQLLAAVK
jgi:hypothetical protein